jgi:hypothetical protein
METEKRVKQKIAYLDKMLKLSNDMVVVDVGALVWRKNGICLKIEWQDTFDTAIYPVGTVDYYFQTILSPHTLKYSYRYVNGPHNPYGPARIYPDGKEEYFIYGRHISKTFWNSARYLTPSEFSTVNRVLRNCNLG